MANRRMFSARITESTKFLKMSATSQNLYFHLCMHADDDGIVEAFQIMRLTGANEGDLRSLVQQEYVTILDGELLITFMNDWLEHNAIRADRKIDSIYQDLLIKVLPDVQILEAKPTYYSRSKKICQTNDRQMTDNMQSNDGIGKYSIDKYSIDNNKALSDAQKKSNTYKLDTECIQTGYNSYPQDRLGKDRLGKVNINNSASKESNAEIESFFESIWKLYPNKKGKAAVSKTKKKELFKVGYDEMSRAISRYVTDLKADEWRKPQYGSSFFNKGYVDYLDKNYTAAVASDPEKGDRSIYKHDYEELKRELGID